MARKGYCSSTVCSPTVGSLDCLVHSNGAIKERLTRRSSGPRGCKLLSLVRIIRPARPLNLGVSLQAMQRLTVASIYAFASAVVIAGFLLHNDFVRYYGLIPSDALLEDVAVVGVYFALIFAGVALFPSKPTNLLLWASNTFRIRALTTSIQRVCFLILCFGLVIVALTVTLYYLNGHEKIWRYLVGDGYWPKSLYRGFFWFGTATSIVGLFGSFLYRYTLNPLVAWIRRGNFGNAD